MFSITSEQAYRLKSFTLIMNKELNLLFIECNMLCVNLQRRIYDVSAVYSLSDSSGPLRTEVELLLSPVLIGTVTEASTAYLTADCLSFLN